MFNATLRLPHAPVVLRASRVAQRRLKAPYAAVHVRRSDDGSWGADKGVERADDPAATATAAAATIAATATATATAVSGAAGAGAGAAEDEVGADEVSVNVAWLRKRLFQRLPRGCSLFVASNLRQGARHAGLAPLCTAEDSFNCSDLASLNLQATPAWQALLSRANLSTATASMLVEQSLSAAAGRGFFSTSKFCGPAGFRRSTFSEGVALRWAMQHGGSTPLCAHAMERALAQGLTAHGAQVY